MTEARTIALAFVLAVLFLTAALGLYSHLKAPKCTYTYDLAAKTIKSTCPIADAGLYDEVIVKTSHGIYITQVRRIADLHLKLLDRRNGIYTYTFTVKGEYLPDAWIVVSFDQ